jgi:hypothetical protein
MPTLALFEDILDLRLRLSLGNDLGKYNPPIRVISLKISINEGGR